jgi:hypothetical protein
MNEQTVQASFADDHDRLDELLATYRRSKRVDFDRAKRAFKQFKVGLQQHILREEGALFPLFEEKTGMHDLGPTVVMRAEHRGIARHLEAIHEKVRVHDVETDQEEEALVVSLSMKVVARVYSSMCLLELGRIRRAEGRGGPAIFTSTPYEFQPHACVPRETSPFTSRGRHKEKQMESGCSTTQTSRLPIRCHGRVPGRTVVSRPDLRTGPSVRQDSWCWR